MDDEKSGNRMIVWWVGYVQFVERYTTDSMDGEYSEITYWRDRLFTKFIVYLFPVCLIALVPGVYMGIKSGQIFIAVFDVLTVLLIAVVVLNKVLKLIVRKLFVVFMLYCLAIALIVNLGSMGPGITYLLMLSILTALLFHSTLAYWSVGVNTMVCAGAGAIIQFGLLPTPLLLQYDTGSWLAVSSNVVFLSLICVILISYTLGRLEDTVNKEIQLKNELTSVSAQIHRRNKRIQESEIHYKGLFFMNPSPMWVLNNLTLKFLQVNEAAIKEYGYTEKEFLTMGLGDIKLEKDMGTLKAYMQAQQESGSTATTITEHRRKNKELFYVEVRFSSFSFNGEDATLSIIRDMTQQISFTKAIEAQNAKLKEIAWIQSHIVRAPLARIMGLVRLLIANKAVDSAEELLYLDQSAKEFDSIIKTITSKTEQVSQIEFTLPIASTLA